MDRSKNFGNGSFIENAVEDLHEILPVSGTVFQDISKKTIMKM